MKCGAKSQALLITLCCSILLSTTMIISSEKDDFIVKRSPKQRVQKNQQLREELAEKLGEYLRILTDKLVLIADRLSLLDLPINEKELRINERYLHTIYEAHDFLHNSFKKRVVTTYTATDGRLLYIDLIRAIASIQQMLITSLRCLLERDMQCHFVSCKTKNQLEKYLQKTDYFIEKASEHDKYIHTIVQNSENRSE